MSDDLIGVYVTLTSARHAQMHGVLLPPTPRGTQLRLANDDGTVTKLRRGAWTFAPHHSLGRDRHGKTIAIASRVSGRPTYRYGDLPAKHLATKTMLRREYRRQPAPGQVPIAYYDAKDLWAPLYAIVDAAPLPPLSENRAAGFTLARTCCVCTRVFERPLQKSPDGDRYCELCHLTSAVDRWAEQLRPVQAEIAIWAATALADPRTVLAHTDSRWEGSLLHVETIDGEQLLHVRLRGLRDLADARDPDRYADTVHASEIFAQLDELSTRRIVTWDGLHCQHLAVYDGQGHRTSPALASGDDQIAARYALWTGRAPRHRYGFWYAEPKLPWTHTLADDRIYRTAADAEGALQALRYHLKAMATEPAPEPFVAKPGA